MTGNSAAIEAATLIEPQETCANCGTEPTANGAPTGRRNWRCPYCSKKCCSECFKMNSADPMGRTFLCPNPSCKAILKFP